MASTKRYVSGWINLLSYFRGSFTNYVDKILVFFGLPGVPTPSWHLWRNSFTLIVENLQIVDISHLQCNLPTSSCQRSLWTTLSFLYIHIQVLGYTYELRHWQLKCSYFWNFMLPKVSTFHFSIWQWLLQVLRPTVITQGNFYEKAFGWNVRFTITTSKYWIFDKVSTHK